MRNLRAALAFLTRVPVPVSGPPDLSAAVRRYDDGELAAIVRQGVRPDGRSLLVMPSEAYASMSDVDLGRIVGFLRSLPAAHGPGPQVDLGPLGSFGLATGKFRTAARILAETNPPPAAIGAAALRRRPCLPLRRRARSWGRSTYGAMPAGTPGYG